MLDRGPATASFLSRALRLYDMALVGKDLRLLATAREITLWRVRHAMTDHLAGMPRTKEQVILVARRQRRS